jgi:hypothetical protein
MLKKGWKVIDGMFTKPVRLTDLGSVSAPG